MLEVSQTGQSAQLVMVRDQLSVMNSKLDSHTSCWALAGFSLYPASFFK